MASSSNGVHVDISGLCRSYSGRPVLNDISLHIEPGEIFVIMGPSGSGKSVFLRHLIGLERPDEGEIRIGDASIRTPGILDRYRSTMVFQSSALLNSLTVGENIGLYLREHRIHPEERIREIVRESLSQVGLGNIEEQYPNQLSGGMKKRVAIARALVVRPHLILYDEPTSELDPMMASVIGAVIDRLNRQTGVTTVIVTHERELAFRLGHRIAIINNGRILTIGTLKEILMDRTPFVHEFLMGTAPPGEEDEASNPLAAPLVPPILDPHHEGNS